MAVIALGLAGSAIGGSASLAGIGIFAGVTSSMVGGAIGAAVGGVIDSQFLMPALFGRGQAGGMRLSELDVQTATEGSPIKLVYGSEVRVAGTIVWLPTLEEVEASGGGGKGGFGGSQTANYSYYMNCAVLVCRGPISKIKKIWADGRVIYEDGVTGMSTDITFTSDQFSLDQTDRPGTYGIPVSLRRVYVDSPVGGPDLREFSTNRDVVMSGWSNPGNNGTYRMVRSIFRPGIGTRLELMWKSSAVDEIAGASVTISQEGPVADAIFDDLQIYPGNLTQTADPTYDAATLGNAPSFRSWCYVVFKRFALAEFGNRVPQFSFLVEESATRTVGEAISGILQNAGLQPSEIDVSTLTMPLRGIAVPGSVSPVEPIEAMMMAYDLTARESNGKLEFFRRQDAQSLSVDAADLAAHEEGEEYRTPAMIWDEPKYDLPAEINIDYYDPEVEWSKASQNSRKTAIIRDNSATYELPMTLTGDEARSIAKRLLMTAWAERRKMELKLPPSYLNIQEGDIISSVVLGGQSYSIRVDDIARGNNLLCQIKGTVTQTQTAIQNSSTEDPTGVNPTPPYYPPVLETLILDIPGMTEEHTTQCGVYYATVALDPAAEYRSATMLVSSDDLNYSTVGELPVEATAGSTETELGVAEPYFWDEVNTLDIELMHGSLESRTATEVLNGENIALVGQEIIGFRTATLIGTRRWRISGLLRGLRNTEIYITEHNVGDVFVLIEPTALRFKTLDISSLDQKRYWKSVPQLGNILDATPVDASLSAATLRPFSPCQLNLTRDGSNNLIFTWQRRSRAIHRTLAPQAIPTLVVGESYVIVVTSSATPLVTKTFTVSDTRSFSYSSASQSGDGFTPGSQFTFTIYEISPSIGAGNASSVSIT